MARTVHMPTTMKRTVLALAATLSMLGAGSLAAGCTAEPASHATQVEISVTSEGFQPAEIETRAGHPLRLVITRKTDRTCAKEIVIKDLGLSRALPLNEPVAIEVTPTQAGRLRYACSMDMLAGVIVVK